MKYYISSDLSLSMLSVRALKLFNFLQAKANRKTNSSFWSVPRMAQEWDFLNVQCREHRRNWCVKALLTVVPGMMRTDAAEQHLQDRRAGRSCRMS